MQHNEKNKKVKLFLGVMMLILVLLIMGYFAINHFTDNTITDSPEEIDSRIDKKNYSNYDFIAQDSTFYLEHPEEIKIDDNGYITVEGTKFNFLDIKKLRLGGLGDNDWTIKEFPFEVLKLKNLEYLSLSFRGFEQLPNEIVQLDKLKILDLQHSAVEQLPENIAELKNLEQLILLYSNIRELPDGIIGMSNLKILNLGCTKFERIPRQLFEMRALERLLLVHEKECDEDTKIVFYDKAEIEKLKRMLSNTKVGINSG